MQSKVFRAIAGNSLRGSIWRRRNRNKLWIAGAIALITYIGAPGLLRNSAVIQARMGAEAENVKKTELLKISEKQLGKQAAIADQRLQRGCLFPVVAGKEDQGRLSSISEGTPVTNPDTGLPFPDGVTICDPYGSTGVIRNGGISDITTTQNTELIRHAMANAGLKMKAGNPDVTAAQGSQGTGGI